MPNRFARFFRRRGPGDPSSCPPPSDLVAGNLAARNLAAPDVARDAFPGELTSESPAAAADASISTALSTFLAGHVLRDGELVVLMIRPSKWFILLTSLRFLAATTILVALAGLFEESLPYSTKRFVELGAFVAAGRLMWATVQWMSKLYILTDLRILSITGVFTIDVFDCPLRKVARTLLDLTFKERLVRVGTIIIIPQDEEWPLGQWQMVARPKRVHAQIVAQINRARHGGVESFR